MTDAIKEQINHDFILRLVYFQAIRYKNQSIFYTNYSKIWGYFRTMLL